LLDRALLPLQQRDDARPVLFAQQIELGVQGHHLDFGADVHFVVGARVGSILRGLAVLAHHDHRRLQRRHARQHQVQQDEREGIEGPRLAFVEGHPADEDHAEQPDERPAAAESRDAIGEAIAERRAGVEGLVGISRGVLPGHDRVQQATLEAAEACQQTIRIGAVGLRARRGVGRRRRLPPGAGTEDADQQRCPCDTDDDVREQVVRSDEPEAAEHPAAHEGTEPAGHQVAGQPEVTRGTRDDADEAPGDEAGGAPQQEVQHGRW